MKVNRLLIACMKAIFPTRKAYLEESKMREISVSEMHSKSLTETLVKGISIKSNKASSRAAITLQAGCGCRLPAGTGEGLGFLISAADSRRSGALVYFWLVSGARAHGGGTFSCQKVHSSFSV